jgi:hypothetical protein
VRLCDQIRRSVCSNHEPTTEARSPRMGYHFRVPGAAPGTWARISSSVPRPYVGVRPRPVCGARSGTVQARGGSQRPAWLTIIPPASVQRVGAHDAEASIRWGAFGNCRCRLAEHRDRIYPSITPNAAQPIVTREITGLIASLPLRSQIVGCVSHQRKDVCDSIADRLLGEKSSPTLA